MIETLMGLDVGTTSTKAVLFDLNGEELARSTSSPYHHYSPQPGWVEQDPEEIWQAVLSTVRQVMAQVNKNVRVRAISMASQSGSLLPADAHGRPVYHLITWMDGRTTELVRYWRATGLEGQVKSISGWSLHPGLCLPTIAWLRQNAPNTFFAARRIFSVNDFIAFRLTGQYCTNPSNGGGMQLVDIQTGRWSSELCALAGITTSQLSPIRPSGAIIGPILPDVCRQTGLTEGALLVNGGHDQGCTALGLGVNTPGRLLLAGGTAWVITGVVDRLDRPGLPAVLDLNFHPAPQRWTLSQSLGGLGAGLEWWVQQAWQGTQRDENRQARFAALNQELSQTSPGGGGLFFCRLPVVMMRRRPPGAAPSWGCS